MQQRLEGLADRCQKGHARYSDRVPYSRGVGVVRRDAPKRLRPLGFRVKPELAGLGAFGDRFYRFGELFYVDAVDDLPNG